MPYPPSRISHDAGLPWPRPRDPEQLELPLGNPNAVTLADIVTFIAGIPAAVERSAFGQAVMAFIEWLSTFAAGFQRELRSTS